MTFPLHPRLTPARPDLAARHLEGKVAAARFVDGEPREVIEPHLPLRRMPSPDALLDTEVLMGERVTVYETTEEGWAWGQLDTDGYVGFMPASGLGAPGPAPTHRVSALRTLVFPTPSFKLSPIGALPLGARLALVRGEGRFALAASGGYVPATHLAPVATREGDFVAVAERFLGTPYLWGGKTSLGLDCSGLVQVALTACGFACPRDTDMQQAALGAVADGPRRRGDLIFWRGHVAIVRDASTVIHANAFHMAVAIEPVDEAIARIRASDGEVTIVRRLAGSVP
ncbi:MAG TPA: NlpC/P60 family protein [Xanthobacteraceae bacterium]|jgi:cell wall-associated NlpC family hydrolase|nr:NlpC/P60 family protein [Xanthobacteraceae bacterium]